MTMPTPAPSTRRTFRRRDLPSTPRGAVTRFVLLGAANTTITFALFTALQHVSSVTLAYSIAFAAGLVFSTALTARIVFGARTTRGRRAIFAFCYLAIYVVGLVISNLLDGHVTAWVVSGATIAVTAPLGFLCGRAVLVPPGQETPRSP